MLSESLLTRIREANLEDTDTLIRSLSADELAQASMHAAADVSRLSRFDRLTAAQDADYTRAIAIMDAVGRIEHEQRAAQLAQVRAAAFGGGGLKTVPGAFGDTHAPQHAVGLRGDALRLVDSRHDVADEVRHAMATAVDKAHPAEVDRYARYIRAAGDPAYERAFSALLRDPVNGHREFTDEELRAFQRVQYEARALNLTDANGGYLVPATVDFSIQLTNSGSVNPLRAIARHVTTAGNDWSGITSAGSQASWDAEAAEVSPDDPTFAQPTIPVFKGACYIQASFEIAADTNIGAQLGPIFADARDQLEASAFTLGTGSGQPTGIITAVAAVPGSVVTSSATSFTAADVINLQNAVPPRWRPRARFMANLSAMNAWRTIIAGTGLTTPLLSGGEMLGWPVVENSVMDGTITGTANDYVLLAGDFSNFVIVDRIGLTVVNLPVVVGSSRRPTGETGWYAYWRTGSGIAGTADAFRLLNLSA